MAQFQLGINQYRIESNLSHLTRTQNIKEKSEVRSQKYNGGDAFRHIVPRSMTKLGSVPELLKAGLANVAFSKVLNISSTEGTVGTT